MKQGWRQKTGGALAAGVMALAALPAHGAGLQLSDAQMDSISAGEQYSVVAGAGTADVGTVAVTTRVGTRSTPGGVNMTKGKVTVLAEGSGLQALAYGESGANGEVSTNLVYASSPSGTIKITLSTVSLVTPSGQSMTKTQGVS